MSELIHLPVCYTDCVMRTLWIRNCPKRDIRKLAKQHHATETPYVIMNQAESITTRSGFGPNMHANPSAARNFTYKGRQLSVHETEGVSKCCKIF
ncbi:hypothetical protein [Streptomyces rubiginosohelvolus]|uniref:Uncharacterized protein n=1 Tax=Streptomyces rubiginosohelvolus TaxID=67362 RepID=A0ABW6EYD6_9ACTN